MFYQFEKQKYPKWVKFLSDTFNINNGYSNDFLAHGQIALSECQQVETF